MPRARIALTGLCAAFVFAGCNPFEHDLVIRDLSKPSTFQLETDEDAKVHGITVDIACMLSGTVKLELLQTRDGQTTVAHEDVLTYRGKIHWDGDWYSPSATLRVTPLTRSRGRITVSYRFHTL